MSKLLALNASTDESLVGVKAARLASIAKGNLSIPDGFIIPANVSVKDGISNDLIDALNKLGTPAILRISAPNDQTIITSALLDINSNNIVDTVAQAQAANPNCAIIIQKSLNAEIWGTATSINPETKATNEIYTASSMFSIADPDPADIILLDKNTGSVIAERQIPDTSILTSDHLESIHSATIEIERIFKVPVRIKLGFDTGKLYIIGVKPL
ncbi:MAG: hypothetical protein ACK5MU_01100 [Candidatus Saccharimonadales bacterium]